MTTPNPDTINCAEACLNGCLLGDRCPHLAAAQTAIDYVGSAEWTKLMEQADTSGQPDPLKVLENFQVNDGGD